MWLDQANYNYMNINTVGILYEENPYISYPWKLIFAFH